MKALALLLLSTIPHDAAAREYVDAIVVSHVYDATGCELKHRLSQLIFLRHNRWTCEDEIVDWRMLKEGMQPTFNRERGVYEVIWWDDGILRHVEALSSWPRYDGFDPEWDARNCLPTERRQKLRGTR
jgi:hypothetical protein